MADRIIEYLTLHRNKHVVMTQIVFKREIRDYIRKELKDDLATIILNTNKELLVQRLFDQSKENYEEMEQPQYLLLNCSQIEKKRTFDTNTEHENRMYKLTI